MKIERRSEKKSPPKTNHQTRREDYSLGKEILTRFHDKSRFALQVGPVSAREEEGRIPPREMKEKYLAFAAYNFGRVCRESQRGAGADEDNPTPGAKVTTCLLLYQTTKPLKKGCLVNAGWLTTFRSMGSFAAILKLTEPCILLEWMDCLTYPTITLSYSTVSSEEGH